MGITKVHKVTNTLTTPLPPFFRGHKGRKWIIAERCKIVDSDTGKSENIQDIELHADIMQIESDLDYFIFYTNETREKYKKYEQFQSKQDFKIWFLDSKGVKIPTKIENGVEVLDGFTFRFEYMLVLEDFNN